MIEDIRSLPDRQDLHYDVCIAGAGAAGITLAMSLSRAGLKVCLLEGGGLNEPDEEEKDLYRGTIGNLFYPLETSRLRYFGGTTNIWGGWCRPLDPIDFVEKSYVPLSGWPIGHEDLAPYYSKAHRICQINSEDYGFDQLSDIKTHYLPLDTEKSGLTTKLFRFSPPTRFGEVYRETIEKNKLIDCFLHANVVSVEKQYGRISNFLVKTLDGKTFDTYAKYFILAMGGIEIPRFLLNNKHEAHPAGLGNESDYVGRCFMDHFGYRPGYILAEGDLQYFRFRHHSEPLMPVLSITDKTMAEKKMLNFCAQLLPHTPSDVLPPAYLNNYSPPPTRASRENWRYAFQLIGEPAPNPMSRVYLNSDRDALGMQRLTLDWRLSEIDATSIKNAANMINRYLESRGLGRAQRTTNFDISGSQVITVNWHHMGTTRMGGHARHSVVDSHCKVWAEENLFIASSSVFSSAGFSNPTLTIVALALRLANHIATL